MIEAPGGKRPYRYRIQPSRRRAPCPRLFRHIKVDLLDGNSLSALPAPDMTEFEDVSSTWAVAWSRDGAMLLAGGNYFAARRSRVRLEPRRRRTATIARENQ